MKRKMNKQNNFYNLMKQYKINRELKLLKNMRIFEKMKL